MSDRGDFVRALPKAELHVHIEGTLEPELMFEMGDRNGISLPYPDVEAIRRAYAFTDLQSFLDIYYAGAAVLRTERDFHDLMSAYLARARADGVVRAEIFFDPQTHLERGTGFEVFMEGFRTAIEFAERQSGISVGLIMCFLRHLGPEAAMETWRKAQPWLNRLLGVGLDSSERGFPPDPFADVYRAAGHAGLHRVAHAGEEGPPGHVIASLDLLECERIDHGVRSEEDPELIARLANERIPLTVCPLSNLALQGVARLEDHNLGRLLEAGVVATINSDDPAYFGGYVADNYLAVAAALDLGDSELVALAHNSLAASFAGQDQKDAWIERLSEVAARA